MLNFDRDKAFGRSFAEVVRHHQLIELWQLCRTEGHEAVAAVEIDRNLFLQAFVTPFEEHGHKRIPRYPAGSNPGEIPANGAPRLHKQPISLNCGPPWLRFARLSRPYRMGPLRRKSWQTGF